MREYLTEAFKNFLSYVTGGGMTQRKWELLYAFIVGAWAASTVHWLFSHQPQLIEECVVNLGFTEDECEDYYRGE